MSDKKLPVKSVIEQLANRLVEKKFTLAVAESCTGGMFAQHCTALSGSSKWFECGFVTYSNASKIRLLGVQADVLNEHGAVSAEVAEQMATGVLKHSDADISASTTGIAGPSGGSESKPVGTVYISIKIKNQPVIVQRHQFQGDRQSIRKQTTHILIVELISCLGMND